MKILAIGNSFSTDATAYLEQIAASAGEDLMVRNCFIGGCSLQTHDENSKKTDALYEYQKDGEMIRMISLQEALRMEVWDAVTLQQASHYSGMVKTYQPYLGQLIRFVSQLAPQARIVFHETWAYEIDSPHPNFCWYGFDQIRMHDEIKKAVSSMAKKYHLPVIPTGDIVQKMRQTRPFDLKNGGLSLNRDGFHLSFDYGRYLAGLVWFSFFTGKPASLVSFAPAGTDPQLIAALKNNQ
jgi:hypothetical protein